MAAWEAGMSGDDIYEDLHVAAFQINPNGNVMVVLATIYYISGTSAYV